MSRNIIIRVARPEDAAELMEIYKWYVENTALSYEYVAPTVEEFHGRMNSIMKQYPYLVAEQDGGILGYAYAAKYRERAAYAWNAETSIYLRPDARGMGLGTRLYALLEDILCAQGVFKLMASVTETGDEHTGFGSMQFHQNCGFSIAGRLENCGYKFGRWYTTLIMDKYIAEVKKDMCPIRTFDEVRENFGL